MTEDFRPHVVMGIIILILALTIIALTFIPKPMPALPGGGNGQFQSGYVQPASPAAHASQVSSFTPEPDHHKGWSLRGGGGKKSDEGLISFPSSPGFVEVRCVV